MANRCELIDAEPKLKPLKWTIKDICWRRLILMTVMHIQLPYGIYLFLFVCKGYTAWWSK